MRTSIRTTTQLFVVLALALSACGDDTEESTDTVPATTEAAEESAFPVTVQAANGAVTLAAEPSAIVSLSPTATEMLFAIGAGGQVKAVDDYSNFPAEAPITDLSAFEPNVEAIASYEPDLVVVSDDMGGVIASLQALDIPVLQLPAATNIADSYAQMEQLGAATGHLADATSAVADLQTRIEAIVASVEPPSEPLTYYHELDDTYYSVTSSTFIGEVYSMLGLVNIADAADDGSAGGYPQLSVEYIVDSDPDLIFLADTKCCGQTAATVAARPGWDGLQAVTNGAIVEIDDDVASRWGPRIADLLETVAIAVSQVPVG